MAERSGVDPSECQERSGYYMISEQSVNTQTFTSTILLYFFLVPDWDWDWSILFKNKHIDGAKQAGYKLSWDGPATND